MPFGELLTALLNEGFIVDAKDFAEFTAVFKAIPENEQVNLKYYLAPLICRNNDEQKKLAEQYKKKLNDAKIWDDPIVTEITPFTNFYSAEDYHQNYYNQNAGTNSYCAVVIRPKLQKLLKEGLIKE